MKVALLKAFCQKNDFQQAYDIFVKMKAIGLHEEIVGTTFLILADSAAKNGRIEGEFYALLIIFNVKKN